MSNDNPLGGVMSDPRQHEPTTEDLCAQGGHAYAGDDAGGGRCYCGQTEYPLGGSSRADRGDRA